MACFTRPEMKVERVSYDIITPSAARAIFESIFWKPAIQWNITRIEVLNPIRWFSMKRNEIGSLMSPRSSGLFIEDNRQQKSSLLLKDVCYRIFAELEFIPIRNRAKEDMYNPQNEMFRLLGTKRSFSQNETFFFSHPYPALFRLISHF